MKCLATGTLIESAAWKREPACLCTNCVQHRAPALTNHDTTQKRQFIAVKFEIDLPLRDEDVAESVGLLDGLLAILRQSQSRKRPPAVDAVDPVAPSVPSGPRA